MFLRMVEDRGPYAGVGRVRVSGLESLGYEYMGYEYMIHEANNYNLLVMRQKGKKIQWNIEGIGGLWGCELKRRVSF